MSDQAPRKRLRSKKPENDAIEKCIKTGTTLVAPLSSDDQGGSFYRKKYNTDQAPAVQAEELERRLRERRSYLKTLGETSTAMRKMIDVVWWEEERERLLDKVAVMFVQIDRECGIRSSVTPEFPRQTDAARAETMGKSLKFKSKYAVGCEILERLSKIHDLLSARMTESELAAEEAMRDEQKKKAAAASRLYPNFIDAADIFEERPHLFFLRYVCAALYDRTEHESRRARKLARAAEKETTRDKNQRGAELGERGQRRRKDRNTSSEEPDAKKAKIEEAESAETSLAPETSKTANKSDQKQRDEQAAGDDPEESDYKKFLDQTIRLYNQKATERFWRFRGYENGLFSENKL